MLRKVETVSVIPLFSSSARTPSLSSLKPEIDSTLYFGLVFRFAIAWVNKRVVVVVFLLYNIYMVKTKKFTILHSNDMHGDFFAEDAKERGKLIGGLSLLSGYVNKVRKEEKNVFYVVSGDMLQGSIVDSEYKGISTIEIMNYLAPDVVCLGNHEFDYGLPHLLFLERVANFPIVNANLYIKKYNKRLMKPHLILKKDGFDVLFTGIITEKVMDTISQDSLVGSFISLNEASQEVGKICNAYKNDDIDLTILLTHIGLDSDKKLAKLLKPEWGVDMIIGGHSHSMLEKPVKTNNVLIAQAGVGTDQIGRFDIEVDDVTNSIVEYKWKLIPIEEGIASPDKRLLEFINSFKSKVDRKYNTIVGKFLKPLLHPRREEETPLGNLIADALATASACDVMLVGSGSIRVEKLGPVVTLMDLLSCYPYNDALTKYSVSGATLWEMFSHFMRKENRNSEGECYQVNDKVRARYSDKEKRLISLEIDAKPLNPEKFYSVCIQPYHFNQCKKNLNVSKKELLASGTSKVVTTSSQDVLEEFLRSSQNISREVEGRLEYV